MSVRRIDGFRLTGRPWWARLAPERSLADLARKPWMEGFVTMSLALALGVVAIALTPGFGAAGDWGLVFREVAEKGFLAVGLTLVMVGGGIDLSIGSTAGVAAMTSLVMFRVYEWPVVLIFVVALAIGAFLGAVNGILISRLNTRAFITTLITLLAYRAVVQWTQARYAIDLVQVRSDPLWSFVGKGTILGIRTSVWLFLTVLAVSWVFLTRSRWGWWLTATGADRRSARRNGIPVTRVQFLSYVAMGVLAATTGLILAARQGSTSDQVAAGYEIVALTAVVMGGVSLQGGRGSVIRATVGTIIVAIVGRVFVIHNVDTAWTPFTLAIVLLVFALLDLKWGKYRSSFVEKLSLSPARIDVGPLVDPTRPDTVWALNEELARAEPIGLGLIDGGEDCILDADGNLYCGDRRGWVWRFEGPDHTHGEIFARTGGLPLGHAWDHEGNLIVATSSVGLSRIDPDGNVEAFANRTRRNWLSLYDDTAVRFADDLDVAPDGSIYFSDFSTRTTASAWHLEVIEFRPNGRLMRWDPTTDTVETIVSNYVFPNGVCVSHDGMSILVASTGLFRVDRIYIAGPRQGDMEPVLENLPGFPDNINRASDGNYWLAFAGARTPMFDLLLRHPAFRRRMLKELPFDEWGIPQLNAACVVKFSEAGEILKVLWDREGKHHPLVTSMREFDGHLYLGGLHNNRIGRLPLDPADIGEIDPIAIPTRRPHRAKVERRPVEVGR